NAWFDLYWEKQLTESGLTDRDLALWRERRASDRECSVEEEIKMLRRNYAQVQCVYLCHKFAVILAIK
ncbi:MAG: class I SAM-dependent methyltransferase, partial [Christensenellaceae bacterium]